MNWDTFKQGNYSTVGEDAGCRVGEVRASNTSPHARPYASSDPYQTLIRPLRPGMEEVVHLS